MRSVGKCNSGIMSQRNYRGSSLPKHSQNDFLIGYYEVKQVVKMSVMLTNIDTRMLK